MCIDLGLCVETKSIRISTLPPKGPYRVGQTVQFSCEVDTQQNVTITWNVLAVNYRRTARHGSSFNWTFSRDYTIHYCLFYCTGVANGSVIGRARRVVEVQGKTIMNFKACVDSTISREVRVCIFFKTQHNTKPTQYI